MSTDTAVGGLGSAVRPAPAAPGSPPEHFPCFYGLWACAASSDALTQAWSLSTKISFYLFLPVWAAFMRRAARDTRRILPVELAGLALLYAISVGFRVWVLLTRPADFGTMGTWLPAYFDLFAMG